jgi:DNA-binding transcriptional LysR family regulator
MDWKKLITIKHLRTLHAISEAGSLANAANILNLSPPAVTIQLNQLEEYLNVKILERGPNGFIKISSVGYELLKLQKQIDNQISRSFQRIEQLKIGKTGYVKLGAVTTAQYFCPWIIAKAQNEFPDLLIDLVIGNRNEIIKSLREGNVDLAITGRPPIIPKVNAEILGDNTHIIITKKNHKILDSLKNYKTLKNEQIYKILSKETFLVREEGSGTRILLERFLDTIGKGRQYDKKEFSSNEAIKQGVLAGLGIAMISASTALNELNEGIIEAINLINLPIVRQWFLVNLQETKLDPDVLMFKKFLLENKIELMPKK